jgi:hypothetical protein
LILSFIILFVFIGIIIGLFSNDESIAYGIIILISIGWFFLMGSWAIATLIELVIGYKIVVWLKNIGSGNFYNREEEKHFDSEEEHKKLMEIKFRRLNEEEDRLNLELKNKLNLESKNEKFIEAKNEQRRISEEADRSFNSVYRFILFCSISYMLLVYITK